MSDGSKVDKGRKDALVSAKVRGTIICSELKAIPRLHYLKSESALLLQTKYSRCDSALFASGSALADTVIVKEALTCNSPMESQYYSVVLVKFELVCYYCGFGGDGSLVQDEEISQLCVCGFICFFVK